MAGPQRFEEFRSYMVPVAVVWAVLADTDRLNRAIGLSRVQYGEAREDMGALYRIATSRVAGINLKWREYPFDWEHENAYSVVRVYEEGPLEMMEGGVSMQVLGPDETRICVWSEITPRNALGKTVARPLATHFINQTLKLAERLLKPNSQNPVEALAPQRMRPNVSMLHRLSGSLSKRPVSIEYVQALANWILEAGDEEIGQIRPFEWADRQHLDRHEALRTFLHAVKVGLLNLRWSLMCPNCRVAKKETSSLREVDERVHCDMCGISYDMNFDRYVELRFAVHPVVRQPDISTYCLMGPARSPHILVQKTLSPGGGDLFPVLSCNEPLRLRVLRDNKIVAVNDAAPRRSQLLYQDHEFNVRETRGPFEVRNESSETITVMLEKLNWDDNAVTAARVMAMQEFKDLFSSEMLKPGREIAVESLTLFFSDLGNSTELYERIGDSPAFYRVGEYFEFLTRHISNNRGAVVKTIGDAVMAVFHSPEDALRASITMQREFPDFAKRHEGLQNVPLKIGLHYGPALAVTQNDRLDYFGRTVNIAARVSSAARGGDIIFTPAIADNDGVTEILSGQEDLLSQFEDTFRGVEGTVTLYRMVLPNRPLQDANS